MEEIVKEVFDENKMPTEIKEGNDPFTKEIWVNDEKARIENEYDEKVKATKGDEPIVETEEEKAAKTASEKKDTVFNFDEDEDFKGFGIKSVDDVKAQLKAAKETGASKAEIEAIKAELAETKTKLEAKPKTFFNNAELAKLDKLSKENPEAYERLAKLRWGKMDSMSLLKEQFIKNNPEVDKDIIEDMINRKFGLNKKFDMDDPDEAKEYKMAKAEMDIAAKAATKELLSELDNIALPETEFVDEKKKKEDFDKLKTQLRSEYQTFAEGIEKGFKTFKIQIPDVDEKGNPIKGKFVELTDHAVPDDISKACANWAHEFAVNTGQKPSKEMIEGVWSEMLKTYVSANLPYIVHTAIEKVRTMGLDDFHKKYDHPSGAKNKSTKAAEPETNIQKEQKAQEQAYINS